MTRNPVPDVPGKYGAPLGRSWPHISKVADSIVQMYENNPPKTDVERRHFKVAKAAALYNKLSIDPASQTAKVSLQCVRLDSGGYDKGGAYWGIGMPLYWAGSDCGTIDMWCRAESREDAKARVLAKFPKARFYR